MAVFCESLSFLLLIYRSSSSFRRNVLCPECVVVTKPDCVQIKIKDEIRSVKSDINNVKGGLKSGQEWLKRKT